MRRLLLILSLLLSTTPAIAQDERRVASPNGQLEFRLGLAEPDPGALLRLAYQVYYRGKPLLNTSLMGVNIHFQEPLLGENVGLTTSQSVETARYHSLVAHYMQNGSLGRRIDVEVRAANDGIAFRYLIPQSTPLMELLIEDETTEFNFAQRAALGDASAESWIPLPFVTEEPGLGRVAITEVRTGSYPQASLGKLQGSILVTRLASRPGTPGIAFEGATPFTGPWRVIVVGLDRDRLMQSEIVRSLNP